MLKGVGQMPKSVFAITTVGFYSLDPTYPCAEHLKGTMRQRTVGLFGNLEHAQKILDGDYGDLNEAGWYPWAIIEQIEFGLYPEMEPSGALFYEYDGNGWKKLDGIPQIIADYLKSLSQMVWFAEIG